MNGQEYPKKDAEQENSPWKSGSGWDNVVEAQPLKGDGSFIDPSESAAATIGSNYMQNVLSGGGVKHGYAVLTRKRVYYGGKSFSGLGKSAKSSTEECVVSVEDITLTRFIHARATGALVFGLTLLILTCVAAILFPYISVIAIPCAVAGSVSIVAYFVSRSTLFEIAFPGGKFIFNVKWYPIADMRDFQRQLHLVKDHVKENCKNVDS